MILKKLKMDLIEKDNLRFEDLNIIKSIIEEVEGKTLRSRSSKCSTNSSQNKNCKCERRKKLSYSDSIINKYKKVHPPKCNGGLYKSLDNYLEKAALNQTRSFHNVIRSEGSLYLDFYENPDSAENADANSLRSLQDVRVKPGKKRKNIKYSSVNVEDTVHQQHSHMEHTGKHRESVKKSVKEVLYRLSFVSRSCTSLI
ncbi:hypothetical protein Trydic_g18342 [Trypoxylus dichotomus]